MTYHGTAYRRCNIIERDCNGFTHWHGPATRCDTPRDHVARVLVLAAGLVWLTDLGDPS